MHSVSAYRQSRIILTAWELNVFTAIDESDGSLDKITEITKTSKRAMRMLLDALASYGYIIKIEMQYQNTAFSKKQYHTRWAHS